MRRIWYCWAGAWGLLGLGATAAQDPLPAYAACGLFAGITPPDGGELPPLLAPVRSPDCTPAPNRPALSNDRPDRPDLRDFDARRYYLPESNPGVRQPPCPCLPLGTYWFSAEYLHAITSREHWSTADGPGDDGFRSGLKVNLGLWLDRCHDLGIDGTLFFLEEAHSGSSGILAGRPVQQDNRMNLNGGEANVRYNLFCEDDRRFDLLIGYRYFHLGERYTATGYPGGAIPFDAVQTQNDLHTAQLGWVGEWRRENWIYEAGAKIGLGVAVETAYTNSATAASRETDARLVALPEGTLKIGYQLAEGWRFHAGYQFTYASEIVRPGGLLAPPARHTSDFWVQGFGLALEGRF